VVIRLDGDAEPGLAELATVDPDAAFSAGVVVFEEFESIAADLFDHLIAAVPSFGIQLYQAPTAQSMRGGVPSK
jgi:hypothetical protein